MQRSPERFDAQAAQFDARAGLPDGVGRQVAGAVLELMSARPGDTLLEIGAGTGEIGQHLASTVRYVGLDRSAGMLEEFRTSARKLGLADLVRLVHADADDAWPASEGSITAVFASRAAHLLEPGHLVSEVRRVCRPGGCFLVGRVVRDPAGVKSRLRQQRRVLLQARGIAPGRGAEGVTPLLGRLVDEGAVPLDRRPVAFWTATTSRTPCCAGGRGRVPCRAFLSAQRRGTRC